jgi:hypothetical protein
VLSVSDNAFLDTGNVRAFSLTLSGFDCSPSPALELLSLSAAASVRCGPGAR